MCATYASLDEALQHPWDMAVVATPAHTHVAIGRTLTDRGIPVLMEKPVAVTTDGVESFKTERPGISVALGYL